MVTIAAGFDEQVSGQTFQDVAPGSTFYTYTERLASRDHISGYPCGGAGEPCVPPTNRPYFRPDNTVTRGQTSKIVYNAMLFVQPTGTPTPGVTPTITGTITVTLTPDETPTQSAEGSPTASITVIPTVTSISAAIGRASLTATATPAGDHSK